MKSPKKYNAAEDCCAQTCTKSVINLIGILFYKKKKKIESYWNPSFNESNEWKGFSQQLNVSFEEWLCGELAAHQFG